MKVSRFVLAIGAASFLTACNSTKFGTNKDVVLAKSSVFGGEYSGNINQDSAPGNGMAGDAAGTINQPANGGDSRGNVNQPGFPNIPGMITQPGKGDETPGRVNQPDGTNDEIDLLLMCSDNKSERSMNFKAALADANATVKLVIDTKVCTADKNVIKGLVQKKTFTLADAKAICPGAAPAVGTWSNVALDVNGNVQKSVKGTITLLYARNNDDEPMAERADALCDKRSSPLVIHVNSDINNPQPVALSSQADGIDFDLLGARASYEKVRISWFTNREYGLLTLPDSNGRVNGIDELFGNATVGPDGLFSENGYEALAKYDGTTADGMFRTGEADGIIDSRDPVYSRLRVWVDANRDGVAQSRELHSLRRAGVTFIDLDFSNDYAETDQYGNQTLMKSVVGRADGSLDLIFDVWFAYQFGGR